MKSRRLVLGLAVAGWAATGVWAGGAATPDAGRSVLPQDGLRATNVELYILSQSCFQGEVVPCG